MRKYTGFIVLLYASLGIYSVNVQALIYFPKNTDKKIEIYLVDPITYTSPSANNAMKNKAFYQHGELVRIAQGEYEPFGVLIKPTSKNTSLKASVSDLTYGEEKINKNNINIRVAKQWYQANYKSVNPRTDGTRYLLYELLLKDDSLIRVDRDRKNNYLKLSDGAYLNISEASSSLAKGDLVFDAPQLTDISLDNGKESLLWVTIYVDSHKPPGVYKGNIELQFDGETTVSVPLEVGVLPFSLPEPTLDYGLYYRARLSNEVVVGANSKTPRQYEIELNNMKQHGVVYPTLYEQLGSNDEARVPEALAIRNRVGLPRDKIFVVGYVTQLNSSAEYLDEVTRATERWRGVTTSAAIESFYLYGKDEAKETDISVQTAAWEKVRSSGGKMFAACHVGAVEYTAGQLDQPVLAAGDDYSEVRKWRALGIRPYVYSNPQVGIEDAELYRKNYGFKLWFSPYGGVMNYAYQHAANDIWNDFDHDRYRDHVFAYPTSDGVIDTVQWEGFREAVDDVRYADKLAEMVGDTEAKEFLQSLIDSGGSSFEIRRRLIDRILQN
ncbi:MAG: hypothetical protein MI976_26835 [Pseudomonadales bacterium]|nr:hypothetical protein [Pseudomonadales bacterium]